MGRAATVARRVVSVEHGFHGLTLGALSANGGRRLHRAVRAARSRASHRFHSTTSTPSRPALRTEDVAMFVTEPILGHGVRPRAGLPRGARRCAADTGRSSASTVAASGRIGAHRAEDVGLRTGHPDRLEGRSPAATSHRRDTLRAARVRRRLRTRWSTRSATVQPSRRTTSASSPGSPRCASWSRRGWSSARPSARCCSSARARCRALRRHRDVRGLGLFWAIEFGEPGSSPTVAACSSAYKPGVFCSWSSAALFPPAC